MIKIERVTKTAKIPTRGSVDAAGLDLYADVETAITIPPNRRALIPTNVRMQIPKGHYGRIAPRSGLALKNGIDVMAGVIDADYRGTVGVILYNTDHETEFTVSPGDKVAQIIIEHSPQFTCVEESTDDTARGSGGYGSTGQN